MSVLTATYTRVNARAHKHALSRNSYGVRGFDVKLEILGSAMEFVHCAEILLVCSLGGNRKIYCTRLAHSSVFNESDICIRKQVLFQYRSLSYFSLRLDLPHKG